MISSYLSDNQILKTLDICKYQNIRLLKLFKYLGKDNNFDFTSTPTPTTNPKHIYDSESVSRRKIIGFEVRSTPTPNKKINFINK